MIDRIRPKSPDGQPQASDGIADVPAAGHSDRVASLVRDHNHSLHAFLMARVGDAHEAREIAQEAYVRMLQLDQPGAVSYLRGYLFKTAANIAIDRARERSNRARILSREPSEEPLDELTPDRYALSGEDVDVLRLAISELPERLRLSFQLRHINGLGDAQIGERLGVGARMAHIYLTKAGIYCQLRIQGHSPAAALETIK